MGIVPLTAPSSKGKRLPPSFYLRSPEVVAPDLLGKILIHRLHGEQLSGRIVETEAYLGLSDPASHTAIGKTERNAVLFGPPGVAHVYFIYGMHYCISISCLPESEPGGVLLRALVPISGIDTMARLRGLSKGANAKSLSGGPGKLCQAFGITRKEHNGLDVTRHNSPLQIVEDGYHPETIEITPRIGIRKAADRPLRFVITERR